MRLWWLAPFVCAACGTGEAARVIPSADEIRVAITSDILGTDPGVRRDGWTDSVLHHVVESLVAHRDDGTVGLQLADSIRVSEDRTTYTFTIRDGATFHNGQPVTSAEVKWSWTRMLDPATGFRCRAWYGPNGSTPIVRIGAPDTRTVVFQLAAPSAVFLANMANVQCITAVLHPDSVAADGSWIEPIGTGPYRLREWKRGEYVLLERHHAYQPRNDPADGYAGARVAQAERIRWMVVPEPAVAKTALLAGDVDLVENLTNNDTAELAQSAVVQLHSRETFSWRVVLVNKRDPLLADARIRRALAHAIDAASLARVFAGDEGGPNPSAIPRLSVFHSPPHAQGLAFDPGRARQLAREAGYRGERIDLQSNRTYQEEFDTAIYVQAMLRRAGFNVELQVLDWATQLDRYYTGGYQLQIFGFSPRMDPTLSYDLITDHAAGVIFPHAMVRADSSSLLEASSRIDDDEMRRDIFEQLHELTLDDVPVISLYNPIKVDATSRRVEGYQATSLAKPRLWGVRIRGQ
jgi:peptide/nickel transport system substrate-binding protein